MDTIFALASARGKSGVAVIRVSGPEAFMAVSQLTGSVPSFRTASLREVRHGGKVIDHALVLTFGDGKSFTGEDVAEFHVHGSPAVVTAVLKALSSIPGLRLAEAGEFTRRALENNRLDLAEVEGLSDLIDAETEAQRIQAMRVFSGHLGAKVESWRSDLIRAAALLEATIDFVDEDVPVDVYPEVSALLKKVINSLSDEMAGADAAERVRDGFEVAIVGPPNAGKSTLLNALAGRQAAITSEVAGTTRDVIEVRMDLKGLPVTVLDTAGLRETVDEVESLGIDRARMRAEDADLRVILLDAPQSAPIIEPRMDDIVVAARADTICGADFSGITGEGVDTLIQSITSVLADRASTAGTVIRERHRVAIVRAHQALGIAQDRITESPELAELIAEEVRTSIRALDSLVGRVDVEHLLDEIFSSFCIGK